MSETFVTSDGRAIKIQPISLDVIGEIGNSQRRKAMKSGALVAPPVYIVETAGGEKQTFPHDAVSIEDASDEEKKVWQAHLDSEKMLATAVAAYTMRYALMNGVVDKKAPQAWLDDCEWNGIELPDDEREQTWLYIRTGLVPVVSDQALLFTAILRVSSEGSEELKERVKVLEDTFRSKMAWTASTE